MNSEKTNGVSEKRTVLYDEALTLTGFGFYNVCLMIVGGGCIMCVIIETMSMAFISPAAQCDLNLTVSQKGILASIAFIGDGRYYACFILGRSSATGCVLIYFVTLKKKGPSSVVDDPPNVHGKVISSSHFWGYIADTKGRKGCLLFGLIGGAIMSFASSIVPWPWLFILLRFLNGFFIASASSITLAWIGELHNNHYRPMVISWISAFVAVGQIYIPGLAWAILPHQWSYDIPALGIDFKPWRLTTIVYGLPSFLLAIMVYFLPESPKFLLSAGHHDETLKILSKIYAVNTKQKAETYPVSRIVLDEIQADADAKSVGVFKSVWKQTVPLFNREFALKTVLMCYMQFGVFLSSSSLQLWFPQILASLNRYTTEVSTDVKFCSSVNYNRAQTQIRSAFSDIFRATNETINVEDCDDTIVTDAFVVNLCVGVAIGVTYITQGIIINKVGKEVLLIGLSTITAVCGITAQYISGYMAILILIGICLIMSSGVGLVANFVVEVYPTNIRAMGIAISLLFGRIGAAVGSNAVGPMFYNHCDYLFIMFLLNHILIIICVLVLPKTKQIEKINIEEPN